MIPLINWDNIKQNLRRAHSTRLSALFFFICIALLGLSLLFTNFAYSVVLDDKAKDEAEKQPEVLYAPGEVIVKFKEGADPQAVLQEVNLQDTSFERVHSIKPAVNNFKESYKLEKDSEGWYWFKGKKYEYAEDLLDEDLFKAAYEEMSPARKSLYRSYKVKLPEGVSVKEAVSRLKQNPDVEYAEPNYIATVYYIPNDPRYDEQWAHQKTHAELGWDIETGDENVIIAIVDTGVDYNHEDLVASIWRDSEGNPGKDFVSVNIAGYIMQGYELLSGEDYMVIDNDPSDYNGHGTHCAGIASAVGDNGIGVAGVAYNCSIMPARAGFSIIHPVYGEIGLFQYDDIANAIHYAAENNANVISMSFGGSESQLMKDEIDYAYYEKGVTLIAAAGNSSNNVKFYPAGYENVIAVSATAEDDSKAWYSNYGFWVDVCAPGGDQFKDNMILSTVPATGTHGGPSGYKALQGTSMACPYVGGLAALIFSLHPDFNQEEVRSILRNSADDIGQEGFDERTSYGRVNVAEALAMDSPCIAFIASPESQRVFIAPEVISIYGTAGGFGFDHYILEVGTGLVPSAWTTISSGTDMVDNDLLGNWYASSFEESYATLRLTVFNADGQAFMAYCHVMIIRDLHEGWPIDVGFAASPAALGDLNDDGVDEIVIGTWNGVFALEHNGETLPGWPVVGEGVVPAIGNIDDNRDLEVVAGTHIPGAVHAFYNDGRGVLGWPQGPPDGILVSNPMLVDLDLDGIYEVVAAFEVESGPNVYVWHGDGSLVDGWPQAFDLGDTLKIRTAAGNFDEDENPEIALIHTAGQRGNTTCMIFDQSGELLDGWPLNLPSGEYFDYSDLVLGDLTGDGRPEMIFVTSRLENKFFHKKIHAIQYNGSYAPGWPVDADFLFPDGFGYPCSPALGDLNDDKIPEVIIGVNFGDRGPSQVAVFKYDGSLLPGWPVTVESDKPTTPLVADVDSDNQSDIIVACTGAVYALNMNGEILPGWPKAIPGYSGKSPTIGDVDGDSKLELLVGGGAFTPLLLYDLDASVDPFQLTLQWPMLLHDSQRSGCYKPPPDVFPPTDLEAIAVSQTEINLRWQDNSDNEDGFKIERSFSCYGEYTEIAVVDADTTIYTDTDLEPDVTYYYKVCAYNVNGNSEYSNRAEAVTLPEFPVSPSNLVATAISQTEINLEWQDNSDNEDGFKIERSLNSDTGFIQITMVSTNTTAYIDTGLESSTAYYYRVRTYNGGGNSEYSNISVATTMLSPPPAPSNLEANAVSHDQIDLVWQDNSGSEDGFKIEQHDLFIAGIWHEIATVSANTTTYSHTGHQPDTTYTYKVRAYNAAGDSDYSNTASARTPPAPPSAPSDLRAIVVQFALDRIVLNWRDNSDNEDGFKIDRSLSSDSGFTEIARVKADIKSYTNTGLDRGITYYYRVRAYNSGGDSEYSNVADATIPPNRPPELAPIGDKQVNEGQELTFTVTGRDPDFMDRLTFPTPPDLPKDATFEQTKGGAIFSWTPDYDQAGTYTITFTVSDGDLEDSETITITVINVNRPPEMLYLRNLRDRYFMWLGRDEEDRYRIKYSYRVDPDPNYNPACDFNKDGVVNEEDLGIFRAAYRSRIGDPNYNPTCDLDGNGKVRGGDFGIFSGAYGSNGREWSRPTKKRRIKISRVSKGLEPGIHLFQVKAIDKGGKESKIKSIEFEIKANTPPQIIYLRNIRNRYLIWLGRDKEDGYRIKYSYRINNSKWSKSSGRHRLSIRRLKLKRGKHIFEVKAIDKKGLESEIESIEFMK